MESGKSIDFSYFLCTTMSCLGFGTFFLASYRMNPKGESEVSHSVELKGMDFWLCINTTTGLIILIELTGQFGPTTNLSFIFFQYTD